MKTFNQFIIESEHPMIDVDGEQKHRHNSEGKPIHHTDEGIRNFHRWFKGSKAVDKSGRPQVLYHGTNHKFDEFKTHNKSINSTTFGDVDTERHGIFLSDNKYFSKEYGTHVKKVYLNSKNPHKHNQDTRHDFSSTLDAFKNRNTWSQAHHGRKPWGLHEGDVGKHFVSYLKNKGHDSHVFHEDVEKSDGDFEEGNTHVALHSHQIKSADDNAGEFSKKSKSIHN